MSLPKNIEFNRPAKYQVVELLGSGACGQTVRVRDEAIDAEFVAKKYRPIVSKEEDSDLFENLLQRFRDEARILFRLGHPNIVRVYNYFDYSEFDTSYILMEYISGCEIIQYLSDHPAEVNRVFEGVIAGFSHLQSKGVMHRDIRPANILVEAGVPKIIDFGFGKVIDFPGEEVAEKSISLNWWCDTPPEFEDNIYDTQTEVYFVGKLFQLAIEACSISRFKYRKLLSRMVAFERSSRAESFHEVQKAIVEGMFDELSFTQDERSRYRSLADSLTETVSSLGAGATFEKKPALVVAKLEDLYRSTMLEENLPAPNRLVQVFVKGSFKYYKQTQIPVDVVLRFLEMLRGASEERANIVVENIAMRLESCPRDSGFSDMDDEIPF